MAALIYGSDVVTEAISTSSAETSALEVGRKYLITSDVDCFFRTGATGGTATTSDCPLWAKQYLEVVIENATVKYVQAITASGSGTLYLIPLNHA